MLVFSIVAKFYLGIVFLEEAFQFSLVSRKKCVTSTVVHSNLTVSILALRNLSWRIALATLETQLTHIGAAKFA